MAGGMSTSSSLGKELNELLGAFSTAAKDVKGEIKDLEKEAKQAGKEGKGLSKEKQARLDSLHSKHDTLREKAKDQRKQKRAIGRGLTNEASSLFNRARSFSSADPLSIAHMAGSTLFNSATRQKMLIGLSKSVMGRKMIQAWARAGGAYSGASAAFSGAVAAAAPAAGVAAALAAPLLIAGKAYSSHTASIQAMADVRSKVAGAYYNTIQEDYGASKRSTASVLRSFRALEMNKEVHSVVRKAFSKNLAEGTRVALGLGSSKQAAALDEKFRLQQIQVSEFKDKYGGGSLSAEAIKNSRQYQRRIEVMGGLRDKNAVDLILGEMTFGMWGKTSEEAELEIYMGERDRVMRARAENESRAKWRNKNYPDRRKAAQQRDIYFDAVAQQKYATPQQWNKF